MNFITAGYQTHHAAAASRLRGIPCAISKIGVIGMGDVVRRKLWPALLNGGFRLQGIAICSLESESCLAGFPHRYWPLRQDGSLPLDALDEAGFLARDTLWIIATPSVYHVDYALQLAGLARVAIEKPLATDHEQANLLIPYANRCEMHPIDHKLFNLGMLQFLKTGKANRAHLESLRRIEGVFFERDGVAPGRAIDDGIADVQWHLFTPIVAIFSAHGMAFNFEVDRVQVARYVPDRARRFALPVQWTASRIEGWIHWAHGAASFDLRQAKGAARDEKGLRVFDAKDRVMAKIDLNESGWHAHARLLQALMKPKVDVKHTLADAIAVMELVDRCRGRAEEMRSYQLGGEPPFTTLRPRFITR